MTSKRKLEIYKERYATFRHLDRLRWQLLQFVTIGLLALAFVTNEWTLFILGIALTIFGIVMEKIRKGLNKNNKVLRKFAKKIGDKKIPRVSKPYQSFAFWIAWIGIGFGSIFIIIFIYNNIHL